MFVNLKNKNEILRCEDGRGEHGRVAGAPVAFRGVGLWSFMQRAVISNADAPQRDRAREDADDSAGPSSP